MKILFVASDVMEFRGLLRHRSPAGLLGSHEIRLTANGAGPGHAAAAVDAALATFRPDAIASVGFCGALHPALAIADIVVGTTILAGDRTFTGQALTAGKPHRPGTVCSVNYVAAKADEKSRLHATGAIAVEMEAAGVAERAQRLSLPFFCIKTVTDLAQETMANDFNGALRSDGHFDTIKILASSLRHPWVRLPELFRFRTRCLLASRSLGDFIADCRF